MSKLLVASATLAVIAAFAVPASAATVSVDVGDNYYVRPGDPPTVTVRPNDTVTWNFVGRAPHTVTVSRGPVTFDSGPQSSGSYQQTMTTPGTYEIYCTIHGTSQSMVLKVE